MKKLIASVFGLVIAFAGVYYAYADGCYLCKGGGYVKYRGSDTFRKRKQAKKKCNCKVTGTTSSCSNPKCTVSVMGVSLEPLQENARRNLGLSFDFCS